MLVGGVHVLVSLMVCVVVLLQSVSASLRDCAEMCKCKWKNGKKTAECMAVGLVGIPAGLDPEIQVLDLNGNVFQNLPSRAFQKVGLVNLQKMYLSRCSIVQMADDVFYQLSNLVELDLSNNFLTQIPSSALRECPHLRRLQLNNNPIQRIANGTFANLVRMTTLELSNCQIENLEPRAFEGLQKLEFLKLDGNRLRIVPSDIVRHLPHLYELSLHKNPWYCDCNLRGIREWMLDKNIPLGTPPRCEQPARARGRTWDAMELDDFACPPEILAVDTYVTVTEGENATLECKIHAVPTATVDWSWRGRVIANLSLMSFGRQIYLIRETGTVEKSSKLTIMNVMIKDSGRYLCAAHNRAGKVSANLTLAVSLREDMQVGLSGGEIAGIVIGLLLVIAIVFVVVCIIILQHKQAPSEERKSIGVGQFKNFDSVKQNHVELTDFATSHDQSYQGAQSPERVAGNSGYSSDNAACHPALLDDPADEDAEANATTTTTTTTTTLVVERKAKNGTQPADSETSEDETTSTVPANKAVSQSKASSPVSPDQRTWKFRRRDDLVVGLVNETNASELRHLPPPPPSRHPDRVSTLPTRGLRNGFLDDTRVVAPPKPMRTVPDSGAYREESYQRYATLPHPPTWKRGPVHIALSPEARDSPDEGLGDEREYETDILE